MAKRRNAAAAQARQEIHEENVVAAVAVAEPMAHSTTGTYNAVEATFFKRGDLGIVEPPVYLPTTPIALPLLGLLFLAGLTAFVLM